MRARRGAELDGGGADAAGAAVDEQALPGLQAGLGEEGVVRGGEDLGQAPGGRPLEPVGDRHELALVDDRELGLPAAADDGHDAIADLEACGVGPERGDLAGELEAGDVLRLAGRGGVAPAKLHAGPRR